MRTLGALVDPGHGGADTGATYQGVIERDLNLSVAIKLMRLLDAHNRIAAHITRRSNAISLTLDERREIEHVHKPDIVISLHTNISEGHQQGAIGYWWPSRDLRVAELAGWISDRVPDPLQRSRNRGFAAGRGAPWLGRARNLLGTYRARSLLIEMGFLQDEDDRAALVEDDVQWGMAAAIFAGLARYQAAL